MGLSNAFQLCSLIYASLKVIYLTIALYQVAFCSSVECPNENSIPAAFVILLVMIFPALMIAGILKKNLQMLRICKVYNIVEKSVIIFGQLVMIIMMERVYQLYRRRHYVSDEEAMSVELAYGLMAIGVLLTALYLIFRNWMIDGTIASIKEDLYILNRDKYVMQYNCEA
ncbi:AAEL010229-PA [Aedes aegypti]|uniref:AAEL010229-PA n=2 Tax=Aedes aegypti TaxID=7159 RepID=A0A1S4FPM9_AEDAE|nr:uncharacterized protein LOC5580033 [Aedes aegypti]EAT37805.1 AAEL010229-PA [Aedes aegypti]